jgi:BlaI family transcriptional regulator, penicillinase repressor
MTPRKRIPELGPVEFELLRILWKSAPATAGEVLAEYNRRRRRPLAYTTVMTLLSRMVEKEVLSAERERQPFRFAPLIGRDALLKQRVREFVDVFFEGRAADLAVRLIEEGPLPDEALRRLEKLLAEQKPPAPGRRDRSRS